MPHSQLSVAEAVRRVDAQFSGDQVLLAALALSDSPPERKRIVACLKAAGVADVHGRPYNEARVAASLAELRAAGLAVDSAHGYDCTAAACCRAISATLRLGVFDALMACVRRNWNQRFAPRDERQARAWLRAELLAGAGSSAAHLFEHSTRQRRPGRAHPVAELLGQPFDPAYVARMPAALRDAVLGRLLLAADQEVANAAALRDCVEPLLGPDPDPASPLALDLHCHYLICGRLDEVRRWCSRAANIPQAQQLSAAAHLLRGDTAAALASFEADGGKAAQAAAPHAHHYAMLDGLHVLALLRAGGARERRRAEALVANPLAAQDDTQRLLSGLLLRLIHVRNGNLVPGQVRLPPGERRGVLRLMDGVARYWMGLSEPETDLPALDALVAECEAAGLYWMAAQAALLMQRLGRAEHAAKAVAWRDAHGFDSMPDWLEPLQRWRSQLNALLDLNRADPAQRQKPDTRLVWLVEFDPAQQQLAIEPREQKRDAGGFWTKGRPVALKRLYSGAPPIAALTSQDRMVARAVVQESGYGLPTRYHLDENLALRALVGHPLVFRRDDVATRVEIVAAQAQLVVTREGDNIRLTMPLA
ncbi:MAG: hypothetical protein JNJ60_15445, partial [Rhodocyclaceae bacterium]|nr:hypothetical protein [Rhodocyclaceae bacterium]